MKAPRGMTRALNAASRSGLRPMPRWVHGMSLIEILVAIGILGAALMALGALVHLGSLGDLVRDENTALAVAASEIEELRAEGYSALPASGAFSAAALSALPGGAGALTVSDYNAETKEVQVAVSWSDARGAHSVALSTLITETGGLP